MGNTVAILLSYILNFVLILVVISLIVRIKRVERSLVNFTPTEAYAIMENMREMVSESEQIADSLESSIKQREAVLEDLSDLVDEKIKRLNSIVSTGGNVELKEKTQNIVNNVRNENINENKIDNHSENDIKSKIISSYKSGRSESEIAKELGISVTEVRLVVSLISKD